MSGNTRITPGHSTVAPFRIFQAARQIADLMYEYATAKVCSKPERVWLDDRRGEEVNPFYAQTDQGLFLEMYYGIPGSIWTPWGKWDCWGSGAGSFDQFLPEIVRRLGATVFTEKMCSAMGEHGPVYAIHEIDGFVLPEPKLRPQAAYISPEEGHRLWTEMVKDYHYLRNEKTPVDSAAKFALDDLILLERGKREPKDSEHTLRRLEDIGSHLGEVIKYSKDGGQRWHYARLHKTSQQRFSDGASGFCIDSEVMPNVQDHSRLSITDRDYAEGILVRTTTSKEVEGLVFSYDFTK